MTLAGNATNDLLLEPRIDIKSIPAIATEIVDVTYGTQTWMDRNLGARRVATAVNDVFSYGNHYQWGRPADGHEITVWNGTTRTNGRGLNNTTATLATTDAPAHGDFILNSTIAPYDWREDYNINRWATANQGPCPTGYHVPASAEWDIADAYDNGVATSGGVTTGWDNVTETFDSDLKLSSPGSRGRTNGLLSRQGTYGYYWSSNVSGTNARCLNFNSTAANTTNNTRAGGLAVRCLKD